MIEKNTRYVNSFMIEKYLKDNFDVDVKDMSGSQVLEHLFGTRYCRGDFKIVDDCWTPEENWKHRLNRLWAYPLTALCAPYQYVKQGEVGWSDQTRFGFWMLRVTGYRDAKNV